MQILAVALELDIESINLQDVKLSLIYCEERKLLVGYYLFGDIINKWWALILDSSSTTVNKYLKDVSNQNISPAEVYKYRLVPFREFVKQEYNLSLDELITTLITYDHGPKIDV